MPETATQQTSVPLEYLSLVDGAVQHTERHNQVNELFAIGQLEERGLTGIETQRGHKELEFRAGVEIEFQIGRPQKFRESTLEKDDIPESRKQTWVNEIINPGAIQAETRDNSEVIDDFKIYARAYIARLEPQNESEQATKEQWTAQIEEFGIQEVVNFLIYEEFSKPQLSVPELDSNATLQEVDDFTEMNGWIEWRFGNGSLQKGYYDNEGMSELRLAPCKPSEALRRSKIIKERMAEICNNFGLIIRTSSEMEHLNLSVYDTTKPDSASLIGNGEQQADDTVDITSGIMKAHQDGINIRQETMRNYDYMFSEHHKQSLSVGPTRKLLRVLDGRIELRGGFSSAEQGYAWMLAGAVVGLEQGVEQIKQEGYEVTSYGEVYEVRRADDFDKSLDLQIQRAFENSTKLENGGFELGVGYAMLRSDQINKSLFGDVAHDGVSAELVLEASRLNEDGMPQLSKETIVELFEQYTKKSDFYTKYNGVLNSDTLDSLVAHVNSRLNKIRLVAAKAVVGESEKKGEEKKIMADRLRGSAVVSLALGDNLDEYIATIDKATEYFESQSAA